MNLEIPCCSSFLDLTGHILAIPNNFVNNLNFQTNWENLLTNFNLREFQFIKWQFIIWLIDYENIFFEIKGERNYIWQIKKLKILLIFWKYKEKRGLH